MRSRFLCRWIRLCAAPTFAALIAGAPRVANAQRVLGAGDDATIVRRGTARVGAQVTWSSYNQVFQPGGELEALGTPLSPDSLGIIQIETLRPIETALRVLAQQPTATVTLGPIRTDYRARVARTAFMIDLGLTSRIQLSGRLPYEHTISEVVFEANPRDVTAHSANIGLNPALATLASPAAAQNRRLVDSLYRASGELATRLQRCTSNPGDPVCADRARVEALVLEAQAFAAGVARTYGIGADTSLGRLFVPTSNSGLQAAIAGRVASLNTAFKSYIPQLSAWDTPFPAQVPITSSQTQELLGRQLEIAPLGVVERSHIGDVEVSAKLLLIDTFGSPERARASSGRGFRFAVGGLVRFGTGQVDRPDDLVDVGTGDGQTDIEASAYADVVLARRFWMSAIGRYGIQREDELPLRIPNVPRNPYLMAYREQQVNRDLGDYLVLEATPRYVYNDYLSLSAQWSYRRKSEDTYVGVFTVQGPDSLPVSLDASVLGVDTEQTQQVIGAGLSFSTLRAYDRGRARLPLEVQFLHTQSVSGSGYAPKGFSSQVHVRFYTRLFGAPLRPR